MEIRVKPQIRAASFNTSEAPQSNTREAGREVKDSFETQAGIYNASRIVGNKVSQAVTGVTGHLAGNLALAAPTITETYRNLWRAETIGPYAKGVGSVVALAGIPLVGAGALVAAPFMGLAEAFREDYAPRQPLVNGSTAEVAERIAGSKDGPATVLGMAINNMQEFGDRKLAPGEEPWDLPLDKLFKGALDGLNFLMVQVPLEVYRVGKTAVVETARVVKKYGPKLAMAATAGVASTLIAGPAGLAIGVGVGGLLAAKDIKEAVFDKDRSLGSRLGSVAQTLAYIPVGPVMAAVSIKENFGRSFAEGWQGKPIEAITTTGKAVIANAKEALKSRKDGY